MVDIAYSIADNARIGNTLNSNTTATYGESILLTIEVALNDNLYIAAWVTLEV